MEQKLSPRRRLYDRGLRFLVWLCAGLTCALLLFLIGYIFYRGVPGITWSLLTSQTSYIKDTVGVLPNILNTLYIIVVVIVLPLGVGAAIYLTEYAANRRLVAVIEFAAETLTGIPSIIFGLVGMLLFVQRMNLQAGILAGGLTLVVMIPPTSVLTGCILAVGRIVGESAALLYTAGFGLELVGFIKSLHTSAASLTVALYVYATERGETALAFSIAAILMVLTLLINLTASLVGRKLRKK